MLPKWEEKAAILRSKGINATMSRTCEDLPNNWDVADVLLQERQTQKGMTVGEIMAYAKEIGVSNQITYNI